MHVICINDVGKPAQISAEEWIKKGDKYTVIKAVKLKIGNKLAFSLAEKPLSENNFPYEYWDAERFVPQEHYEEQVKYENVNYEIPLDIE
jgi:hypothetical protein